ncbi:MAG TPA: hypothetical protein VF364_10470 [Candidatus Limnocylindria bacterium]
MTIRHLVPAVLALGALVAPVPVAADCDLSGTVDEAIAAKRIVFVGDVADLDGSAATFAVREVWSGDVGPTVTVRGLSDDGMVSEDDRTWTKGATYLVVPYVDGGVLRDNICTASTHWDEDLLDLRPPGAATIAPADAGGPPVLAAILAACLVVGLSLLAFRRRSR